MSLRMLRTFSLFALYSSIVVPLHIPSLSSSSLSKCIFSPLFSIFHSLESQHWARLCAHRCDIDFACTTERERTLFYTFQRLKTQFPESSIALESSRQRQKKSCVQLDVSDCCRRCWDLNTENTFNARLELFMRSVEKFHQHTMWWQWRGWLHAGEGREEETWD